MDPSKSASSDGEVVSHTLGHLRTPPPPAPQGATEETPIIVENSQEQGGRRSQSGWGRLQGNHMQLRWRARETARQWCMERAEETANPKEGGDLTELGVRQHSEGGDKYYS